MDCHRVTEITEVFELKKLFQIIIQVKSKYPDPCMHIQVIIQMTANIVYLCALCVSVANEDV